MRFFSMSTTKNIVVAERKKFEDWKPKELSDEDPTQTQKQSAESLSLA